MQDLTRRVRASLWEPKKGKTKITSFFGTVGAGSADLFFCSKHHTVNILTTLARDIQCEKFIEDESVSHQPCDSMYPNRDKEREDEVNNWDKIKTYSNTQKLGN